MQVTNSGARPVLVSGEVRLLTAHELYKHVVLTDHLILTGRKAVCLKGSTLKRVPPSLLLNPRCAWWRAYSGNM